MSMGKALQELPIGVQDFVAMRQDGLLYVDKTARLEKLVTNGRRYFLSRPRRFGKSLTLSTLDAMFSGKAELFKGLAAERWVKRQAERPTPVLRFDISSLQAYSTAEALDTAIILRLKEFADIHDISLAFGKEERCGETFRKIILALFKIGGPVAVLIDEYDKPMLDNIGNLELANDMRLMLKSFYTVLKSCDEYLRFVMLTGISKFSKTGVFSAMNNLMDISADWRYGDLVGYTQSELEGNFTGWIDSAAEKMKMTRGELLNRLKDYYDGFCFDGETKLYNPFSIMQCLAKCEVSNYWYDSGSPSFIVDYMKKHQVKDPEQYRGVLVKANFASSQEIERANPVSFLYQAGYLTIKDKEEQQLTLDYPNREVRDSIASMYLEYVYNMESYGALGSDIWQALKRSDIAKVVELYNVALAGIPYEDYADQGESWYRSLFLMLLRGAGITANGEAHTNRGRPDVIVLFPKQVIVLEFKYAKDRSEIDRKRTEGEKQIQDKNYSKPYTHTGTGDTESKAITTAVIIIDGKKREAVL